MTQRFAAVLFDCDGVLVDSEPLTMGVLRDLLEQRGWLAADALIYLEREKEMADLTLPASWKLLKDKQAGQVCYQLYLRDTKHDAAV